MKKVELKREELPDNRHWIRVSFMPKEVDEEVFGTQGPLCVDHDHQDVVLEGNELLNVRNLSRVALLLRVSHNGVLQRPAAGDDLIPVAPDRDYRFIGGPSIKLHEAGIILVQAYTYQDRQHPVVEIPISYSRNDINNSSVVYSRS